MINKKLFLSLIITSFLSINSLANAKMLISSTDMVEGKSLGIDQVYKGFGCEGNNISPQISIKNVPSKAKSLAITLYDPNAPTGSGWWHWIVYNIPTDVTEIKSGDKKISSKAVFGRNDFGSFDFGGACPPTGHGKHKYILTVYALSSAKFDLPKDASGALIGYNINANIIEKSSITATFERK